MDFVNHTPFPAMAFQGIDPHGQRFHVVAVRQTLTWNRNAPARLYYAAQPAPLCVADDFFGAANQSSLRQESDLCQYKPRCDVIVNAVAHAPQNRPVPRFDVRLAVGRPGLDSALIDKTLSVTGPRQFIYADEPPGQPGANTPKSWRLTEPEPTLAVPVRDEYAFGGQCRINQGDAAAQRLHPRHRLTPEQLAGHPDAHQPFAGQPAAHSVFTANPAGLGFVERGYQEATGIERFAAPQIEHPDCPLTAECFKQCLNGTLTEERAASLPAGFGIRPKAHPVRAKMMGTIDEAFIDGDAWLPEDFDFAIWNAAPPDQQTDYLEGGETLLLTNLCACDAPGASVDGHGNTRLRLELPRQECFVLARLDSGGLFTHPLHIDTLIIEPETQCVSLVWRAVLAIDEETPVRAVEVRLRSFAQRDAVRAEVERLRAQMSTPPAIPAATAQSDPAAAESASPPTDLSDDEFDAWVKGMLKDG